VRDTLSTLVPRFKERPIPRRGILDWSWLVLSFILLALDSFFSPFAGRFRSWTEFDSADSSPLGVNEIVLIYLGWFGPALLLLSYFVLGLVGQRSRYRPAAPAPRVRRGPATGRAPFRSAALGWSLKLVAAIYMVFLFASPTVDRRYQEIAVEISPFAAAATWSLMLFPCGAIMFEGHRLTGRVFLPGSHGDQRRPFLFLRAFDDDDRRTIQPRGWLARLHGIPPDFGKKHRRWSAWRYGLQVASNLHPARWFRLLLGRPADTAEELIALGVTGVGPLVAIGEPQERAVTSGADRMYVSDDRWQEIVLQYLELAQGVILQPSLTDGVLWEIDRTFATTPRHRVLLSLVNYEDRPNEYEVLWLHLWEQHKVRLPRSVPYRNRPCFAFFTSDGSAYAQPVVYLAPPSWPLRGNAVDITTTLAPYLSGLNGDSSAGPIERRSPSAGDVVASFIPMLGISVLLPACLVQLFRWLL
jgi:hypothetical protein